jgi:hypothetical protein
MSGKRIRRRYSWCILTLLTLLALPTAGFSYRERVIFSMKAGKCSLRVEADDQSRTLRLRVYPESPGCDITKDAMQAVLRETFSRTDPPKLEGIYSSLYLGRIIDYPWLSEYLAVCRTGPDCDGTKWHCIREDEHAFGLCNPPIA